MGMSLIEKLGLEKCKAIVGGAPEWAHGFCSGLSIYTASSKGDKLNITCLETIRTAIADHERTDHCSDIKNHISPNTKVSER